MRFKYIGLFFSAVVVLSLLALFAFAEVKDFVSIDVFNMSRTSAGGGFVISSSSNGFTNRTSLNADFAGAAGLSVVNISGGVINVNVSFLRNGSHGGYTNVTFGWMLAKSNTSVILNTTIFNNTFNQSAFNYSFSSALLPDGIYNITVYVENSSMVTPVVNFSLGFDVAIDRTAPNITAFWLNNTNNFNVTSSLKILINATVNDSLTTVQVVKFGVRNGFSNSTEFNLTALKNITTFASEIDTAYLTDGTYTIAIYANDTLSNTNASFANLTFVLDRTGPNVTNLRLGNWTTGANLSEALASITGNVILNLTVEVNDSLTQVNIGSPANNLLAQVYFNITNSTGQINYTKASQNETLWNSTLMLNISDSRYFPDGRYSILVYANDSLNNYNRTANLTFTIDRTLPTVSVSCSPSNPTSGQTVTCTCTGSDSGTGILGSVLFEGDTDNVESTTATASGTSSVCRVIDYAGNVKTATGSWTLATSSSSSSGGGGGGSGGGVSKGVVDQFEKKVWTSINKGESASIAVKNGQIGVTGIDFVASKTTYGVTLQVEKVNTLPSNVKAVDKKVYSYVKITESNVAKAMEGNAKISFKVTKGWLKESGLQKENVVMYRYVGTEWVGLKTTVGEDDGTYQHYTAETPGFSYFAIGQGEAVVPAMVDKKAEVPAVVEKSATSAAEVTAPVTTSTPAESAEKTSEVKMATGNTDSSDAWWVWIVFVLAIGTVIIVVYWWVKK